MNVSAPTIFESASSTTTVRKRVPLAQLAKRSDVMSASARERVLPSAGKEQVEVAAFQSSI
jgi:FXSXX-COOH protein